MSRMASCRQLLSEGVNADLTLLRLSSQGDSDRIKGNCARVLKNLTSDVNEAIGEGDVAALIAMSLEVSSFPFSLPSFYFIHIFSC